MGDLFSAGTNSYLVIMIWSVLFVLFVARFLRKIKEKKVVGSRIYKLPPGRRGWPIVGDSFEWYNAVASSHPPQFVEQQIKRFGKIFSCFLFGKRCVVSADPSFNRFVMQNEGKLFQSSYPKSFKDLVGKNGVITVHGEQQRKLHSIASNMMRLDKLLKINLLDDIQMVITQALSNYPTNQPLLLQDLCRKLAIHLMVNQLLGISSELEINEMAQCFSDFVDGCLSVPINLPGCAYHTAMKDEQDSLRRSKPVGEEMLTWHDYKAMPFTQCVIDETLRLGGIAIWLLREAKEDVEYQDYVIPKGCFVVPFLSAVHLDENVYNEALAFSPWRWMDSENQEKRNWRSSLYFAPFGGGPRFCPGAELARLQIALFLHYFVTTYRWTQLKDDRMSFFPSARLVNGFQIDITRRHD
ncbi:abietadienol/abietadienal oxidase isoform X2 [Rosa chinensis]|uniref:abietadienol/abietadienal oxidase isoform X2 n=1 Tax=Rosa chinensis TaxID=74649 RepID=UPI000D09149B|nr:abietadienol/abietadienal oxidase isoform X2 [Rosa chinensis]